MKSWVRQNSLQLLVIARHLEQETVLFLLHYLNNKVGKKKKIPSYAMIQTELREKCEQLHL